MSVNEINSHKFQHNNPLTHKAMLSEFAVAKNSQEELSIAVASNLSKSKNKKIDNLSYSDILKRVNSSNNIRDMILLLNAKDMVNDYANLIFNSANDYAEKSNIIYRLKEEGVEPALIYVSIISAGKKDSAKNDNLYRRLAQDFSSDKECLNSIHASFNIASVFSKKINSPLLESSLRKLYFSQNNSISSPSEIVKNLLEYVNDDKAYIDFLKIYREALLKDIASLKSSSNDHYLLLTQKKLSSIISSVSLIKLIQDENLKFNKLIPSKESNSISLAKDICLIISTLNEDNADILLERIAYENINNLNVDKQKSFIYIYSDIIHKLSESFWDSDDQKIITMECMNLFCKDKSSIVRSC